jgi:hypothetical protein
MNSENARAPRCLASSAVSSWSAIEGPEDIADVVTFLACYAVSFMTGQGVNVTGVVRMD